MTFFKHHRTVEHRDGTLEFALASFRKSIYSLPVLRALMRAATHRYLDFLAAIEDPRPGLHALGKITRPVREGERSYRGFNFFHGDDLSLFQTIVRGEFAISGFQARQLRSLHALGDPTVPRPQAPAYPWAHQEDRAIATSTTSRPWVAPSPSLA